MSVYQARISTPVLQLSLSRITTSFIMCDIVASSSFMIHQGKPVPYRLVFTVVQEPTLQYVIEMDPQSLSFSYRDVLRNVQDLKIPFDLIPTAAVCHPYSFRVDVSKMQQYIAKDFYTNYLQNAWHDDAIGCLDTATYFYLSDLFSRVTMLEPGLMEGHMELLNLNSDPVKLGKMAALHIQKRLSKDYHPEDCWDSIF